MFKVPWEWICLNPNQHFLEVRFIIKAATTSFYLVWMWPLLEAGGREDASLVLILTFGFLNWCHCGVFRFQPRSYFLSLIFCIYLIFWTRCSTLNNLRVFILMKCFYFFLKELNWFYFLSLNFAIPWMNLP